jgi:ABC-type transport system involved in cytochrome c biogenesis permease subunit
LAWTEPLRRAAFWLAILTLVVHSWALLSRMYVQGRPPVTNLYSAAVFIGWGCLVLALILEWIFANSLGTFVAGLAGFATMRLALFLGSSGDTLEMMQAVLDTNFWLATHVTIVTSGYAATFVAGILGAIYILRGVFTPSLDKDLARNLTQMIYGTVCFATLLSFTGTVLGGIWADQSWGRFWGWDPKENGALIIVIWNALILHARWAGMVKQRGLAVLTIVGNMVTGWSMFGTNQLGVGLHAYGFNNALAVGLRWFWISQVALIVIGLTPLKHWRSCGNSTTAPVLPKPASRAKGKLAPAR